MKHLMSIVIKEAEACSGTLIFVVGLYCILQSASLPNNRHGAVPQAHKLAQAAGLKL